MQRGFHIRAMAAGLATLLIAGCSTESGSGGSDPIAPSGEASASGTLSPESLVMAETAWLSISEEGAVYTTYLDPDGRYRDLRDGQVVFAGSWEQDASEKLCFTPEEGTGACWTHGAPGLDGVMRATNEAGRAIELKRISYTPPPVVEEETDAPEAGANAAEGSAGDESGGG